MKFHNPIFKSIPVTFNEKSYIQLIKNESKTKTIYNCLLQIAVSIKFCLNVLCLPSLSLLPIALSTIAARTAKYDLLFLVLLRYALPRFMPSLTVSVTINPFPTWRYVHIILLFFPQPFRCGILRWCQKRKCKRLVFAFESVLMNIKILNKNVDDFDTEKRWVNCQSFQSIDISRLRVFYMKLR